MPSLWQNGEILQCIAVCTWTAKVYHNDRDGCRRMAYEEMREAARRNRAAAQADQCDAGLAAFLGVPATSNPSQVAPPQTGASVVPHVLRQGGQQGLHTNKTWDALDLGSPVAATAASCAMKYAVPSTTGNTASDDFWGAPVPDERANQHTSETHLEVPGVEEHVGRCPPTPASAASSAALAVEAAANVLQEVAQGAPPIQPQRAWDAGHPSHQRPMVVRELAHASYGASDNESAALQSSDWKALRAAADQNRSNVLQQLGLQEDADWRGAVLVEAQVGPRGNHGGTCWETGTNLVAPVQVAATTGVCAEGSDTPDVTFGQVGQLEDVSADAATGVPTVSDEIGHGTEFAALLCDMAKTLAGNCENDSVRGDGNWLVSEGTHPVSPLPRGPAATASWKGMVDCETAVDKECSVALRRNSDRNALARETPERSCRAVDNAVVRGATPTLSSCLSPLENGASGSLEVAHGRFILAGKEVRSFS